MTFTRSTWYRVALALNGLNLLGGGYALGGNEPSHALAHAVLAIVFGFWALRLRQDRAERAEGRVEAAEGDRLESLEGELGRLRQELSEAQERLDFTERMLAQRPDPGRVDPQR
jgi:HAMP domain-containing protein